MKNNFFNKKLFLTLMVLSSTAFAKDNLVDQETNKANVNVTKSLINNIYFGHNTFSGVDYRQATLIMDKELQPCPNSSTPPPASVWAVIREYDVGEKRFDMLSSAVLSAILADKDVSLTIADDECYGTRAKIVSVRIDR